MKTFILPAFMLCFSSVKAQQSCFVSPESLGRHIFRLFINHADIAQSPAYPDEASFTKWVKAETVLDYTERIHNLAGDSESVKQLRHELAGVDSMIAERYRDDLAGAWKHLIAMAKKQHIDSKTAAFYKIYFSKNLDDDVPELARNLTHFRVIFNFGKNKIGFEIVARFVKDRWLLESTGPSLENAATSNFDDLYELPGLTRKDYNFSYTAAVTDSLPKADPCYIFPYAFNKKVFQLIEKNAAFGSDSIFITKQEYADIYSKELLRSMRTSIGNRTKADDMILGNTDRELLKRYTANIDLIYKDQFADSWKTLQKELHGQTTDFTIVKTECRVSNYDKDNIGNNIEVETLITIGPAGRQQGIRFIGVLLNNKWRLMYVQSSTVSIGGISTEQVN